MTEELGFKKNKNAGQFRKPIDKNIFIISIIVFFIVLQFIGTSLQNWNLVFDDSYISYRYAMNLSEGYGITWNINEVPTEGYTNLLLILVLAPFIGMGMDPLLVTRVLSFVSVIGISIILFSATRKEKDSSLTLAFLVPAIFLLSPATSGLSLVGLETVIYALLLLVTFMAGSRFISQMTIKSSFIFSFLLFITSMIRPEVVLLYSVGILVYLFYQRGIRKPPLMPLVVGIVILSLLSSVYLLWKLHYFGYVLPNPFYLKAAGGALISRHGIGSVVNFLSQYRFLIALTAISFIFAYKSDSTKLSKWHQIFIFGFFFGLVNIMFFARTDTLMDIQGRFLYPLLPILIYINIPILIKLFKLIEVKSKKYIILVPFVFVSFVLGVTPNYAENLPQTIKAIVFGGVDYDSNSLMQKEYRIAKSLSLFPNIEKVRIAFGDSGVLPYFTKSIWLDTVGLNNSFIARHKDLTQLTDYLFQWNADLIIMPGNNDYTWIDYGHGPLGNIPLWVKDKRFNEYTYIGTSKTKSSYDLHYFIKEESKKNKDLSVFMKKHVTDGRYREFPISIGTYMPEKQTFPVWMPSAR